MTETVALQDVCDETGVRRTRVSHLALALFALALGGFAIGTTEFVTMGLLPQIADGVGIGIPAAGHVVSAYALGVVIGAPLVAAATARLPRRSVLVGLMGGFALVHIATALAGSYGWLMLARFLGGLPHGAYFGIASVVAASLVPAHRRTWAVSMVLLGLNVANLIGVPIATLAGQHLGWRWPYVGVGVVGLLTVLAVLAWVPQVHAAEDASVRSELSALGRVQVWFALGIGAVGFGGMFATFSYITPTMTRLTGFAEATVPLILMVYGLGMTAGAMVAGRVAQYGLMRGIVTLLLLVALMLGLFGVAAHFKPTAVLFVFLLGFLPTVLVPMLQTRLMDVAHEGQSLAAALNHSTLNLANALGAWIGSLVLGAGLGYEWPSRVGALLALLGVGLAVGSGLLALRQSGRRGTLKRPV